MYMHKACSLTRLSNGMGVPQLILDFTMYRIKHLITIVHPTLSSNLLYRYMRLKIQIQRIGAMFTIMIMAVYANMKSVNVRILKSDTRGRSLVAVATSFFSKFATGRGQCVLDKEWPYAYTLLDHQRGNFCDVCLKYLDPEESLTTCSSCNYVSYCSTSCQEEDGACHEQDCNALKSIDLEVNPVCHFALLLSKIIRKPIRSPTCTQDDEDCFPTTVDQLESHHEKLSDKRRDEFKSTLSVLQRMFADDVLPEESSLLKMFEVTLCNGFYILNDGLDPIAVGIYLRTSMVNHSCDPNCEEVFDGMTIQLRTIKDVKAGEEFTICYVDVMNPAKERRAELEDKYHFTCECVKCLKEIKELGSDDGLPVGGELQDLKEAWEQIQVAEDPQVLELCEPYLKPMDSSTRIPAHHHLLVKVRDAAFNVYVGLQEWEKAVEIGKLNTESHRYHSGSYTAILGTLLLGMGKLLHDLGRPEEAREYLTEAKSVLLVTHGTEHSLMRTPSVKELLDL